MSVLNRLGNCHNRFQGDYKKVLCVCSAGLLRSPTAALVLSQEPYNFNTRAAGVEENFALIPVDDVLIEWADEIVCMSKSHEKALLSMMDDKQKEKKAVYCLDIPDNFEYRNSKLISLIKENYNKALEKVEKDES